MKYAYSVSPRPGHSDSHYLHLHIDRVLFAGEAYHGNTNSQSPKGTNEFLDSLLTVPGVTGGFIKMEGCYLMISVCPFTIAHTVEVLVKRIQRRFAKGEGRRRVTIEDMHAKALSLNITREIKARDIFVEAARILPNQDPIRLAAGIKDLNLPPNEALQVLRGLAAEFKGDNADPIRLVAGYKTVLELTKA